MKMRLKSIVRDIFPKRPIQDKLPRITRRSSSPHGAQVRPDQEHATHYFIVHGVARTKADGVRLLRKYPDKTLEQIVKLEKPKPRRMAWFWRSWERAKRWL